MALQQWALPALRKLSLPLDESELEQIVKYASDLPDTEASQHLESILGDAPQTAEFINNFIEWRTALRTQPDVSDSSDKKSTAASAPGHLMNQDPYDPAQLPPGYSTISGPSSRSHTNSLIEASRRRARDEQEMQQELQNLQFNFRIYNSEIDPEHETDFYCNCPIHLFRLKKLYRLPVQEMWARAVMYPGEKFYSDITGATGTLVHHNPYMWNVGSPYGYRGQNPASFLLATMPGPRPDAHAAWIHKVIRVNERLNASAQSAVNDAEPRSSIWEEKSLTTSMANVSLDDAKRGDGQASSSKTQPREKRMSFMNIKKAMHIKSAEEKAVEKATWLRQEILAEEFGRWPDEQWRNIVFAYQSKVGMAGKIAHLRARCPIQYLHLLRAGYFEPIPVAWATQASNPLKFSVEAIQGWRGITPAWRGYEDLAEERLYWVLNHREGSVGMRMKPDFISEMNMARARMATAVEPPPLYFSADDVCHVQHTSEGYSRQVMPTPFRAFDRPEVATDDSMILLDVSGSMNFDPVRPIYNQYLVTGYASSTQPKNKDVAKAIVRRFVDALVNHDHQASGYDLVTFANRAEYIGTVNHRNFSDKWKEIHFGGGTRVMTGWQQVKDLHFQKHSASAIHHPVYGWQAGPETPMLRLLLLLDGEATDMDEFELDLLGLSWAHVTIFLIGVDGCPHHHRHANELQRISDVNHHVSFVDAQGNTPERFVTHELLKRHLGYDISMQEFEEMEQPPPYVEPA